MDQELGHLSPPGTHLPTGFTRRVVVLAPGRSVPFDHADWDDALVVVEEGVLDIECQAGGHRTFAQGSVLSFEGLALRTLRNAGPARVVLNAVRRSPGQAGPHR